MKFYRLSNEDVQWANEMKKKQAMSKKDSDENMGQEEENINSEDPRDISAVLALKRARLRLEQMEKEKEEKGKEKDKKTEAFRKLTSFWKRSSWVALWNWELIIVSFLALAYLNVHMFLYLFGRKEFKMNILEIVLVFVYDIMFLIISLFIISVIIAIISIIYSLIFDNPIFNFFG